VKRILSILLILSVFTVGIKAQTSAPGTVILQGTYTNALGLDTLGASDTIYFKNAASLASVGLNGNYVIQITAVSLSGTVGATATLESSLDGVVWSTGLNRVPGTDGIKSDTLTISAAGTKTFTIASNSPKQLLSAGVVSQTYYTDNTRRYYIRVKLLSGATAQSTKYYMRLITQN
jgi:hypothetical protein